MAYRISDECTACGECEAKCPAKAITAKDKGYCIDADRCNECGSCADICPVAAAKKA